MPNAKLLIVEDEEIVAFDIESTLKSLGYEVLAVFASGEEAIACLANLHPDLVLMDIMLKGEIDGIQAADVIHKNFNIPIVYLTAYGDVRTLERAKVTEPFGYLIKPFEERELYTAVEIALSRHRAEEKMRLALEKEQELNKLKSLFVANASHEFRTPLATIRSSTELLERYYQEFMDEKRSKHFHRIQTAINQMLQLLDDLLVIGKADTNKLEFKPAPLDLVGFCYYLLEEIQLNTGSQLKIITGDHVQLLGYNKNAVTSEASKQIFFISQGKCNNVCVDANLLRQILTNLLSNAIKYSPGETKIIFELSCRDEKVTFRIQDQGIGISPEDQKQLFEPFYRAANVGSIKGTGLGLSIVKKCVELHGSKINVESTVGVGTTFIVTLPLTEKC